jgi:L-alanine-DL-glutamate epimerase-like enolase superfamily enzyme
MVLWDLAGQVLNKPAYQLLGGRRNEPVPVYDGSIYFQDLLDRYADNWRDRFRTEIDGGMGRGHRAYKVKIGRGFKWMDNEPGYERDLEVLNVIREHGGDEVIIGVDANNGYDLARAKQFVEDTKSLDLRFMEELFEEDVEQFLALRRHMQNIGVDALIADGETQSEIDPLVPLMEANAVDVYQLDMRLMGCEGILREAAACRPYGGRVAPHNWGSLIGFYMQLHTALAVPNFFRAEHDPLTTPTLRADGYRIEDGQATVPDSPGFGLALDMERFKAGKDVSIDFDFHAS